MKLYPFLFPLIMCVFAGLPAQDATGHFTRLTSADLLSENHVNCIVQDDAGFMWFGTFDGLNRYDGYSVKTFKPDGNDKGAISGLLIYSLTKDQDGYLWVGTTGKGLNRFDPDTEEFQHFFSEEGNAESLPSNDIQSLLVDSRNTLWVGTSRGLAMLDLTDRKTGEEATFFRFLDAAQGRRVDDLFEDGTGRIWVGTDRGLFVVEAGEDDSRRQPEIRPAMIAYDDAHFMAIGETRAGNLLVGNHLGLFAKSRDATEFTQIGEHPVRDLAIDSSNYQVWVGTPRGVFVFVEEDGQLKQRLHYLNRTNDPSSLSNNTVEDIFVDREGQVWVGTFGGGVNVFNPDRKNFGQISPASVPNYLRSNSIRAVTQLQDGRIVIGTVDGGFAISDRPPLPNRQLEFTHFNQPARVYAFLESRRQDRHVLYIGTDVGTGFYALDLDRPGSLPRPIRGLSRSVFALAEAKDGTLWLGTYGGGVSRWIPDSSEALGYRMDVFLPDGTENGLPSPIVRSLLIDREDRLWIGTAEGIARLNAEGMEQEKPSFEVYQNEPGNPLSLSYDYILPLFESRNGTIWAGTFGGGLNRFVPPSEGNPAYFEAITEGDGLPSGVIKSIQEDDEGKLWVATNKGLVRVNPQTDELLVFDKRDGLQSSEYQEIASARLQDGLMVFAGVDGLDLFYPESVGVETEPIQPVITGLEIGNNPVRPGQKVGKRVILAKSITQTEQLDLKPSENSLALEFAPLNYASPEKYRFAYKLEGFMDDWVYTDAKDRKATFTNLPYRDFTFLVKATNGDGVWSESPTALRISIEPPFYLKWYAYLFYGLCFLGLMYAFRRYSLIDVEEKNRLLIEEVSREKTRELNQLKLQFFTNVSHEFRTPLTLIIGPLEKLLQDRAVTEDAKQGNLHTLMYRNAKYLLRLVNQLLDFRKLDQGKMPLRVRRDDVVSFVQNVVAPFEFLAEKKDIRLTIEPATPEMPLWFDAEVLEKVLYNLLSNAFKFTGEGGRITVAIKRETAGKKARKMGMKEVVTISVADTGIGIPKREIKKIFDRFSKLPDLGGNNPKGSGIGLAYTKSLVDLHHGLVRVDSQEGAGSSFQVTLSADESVYTPHELASGIERGGFITSEVDFHDYLQPENDGTELHSVEELQRIAKRSEIMEDAENSPLVLYIDDDPDLREFIRTGLTGDFRVIAADGGASGLELARTSSPDLIITDLMMPEVDGYQVLRELKEDYQTSHIPVIMLTAKSTFEAEKEGLEYGADGYITKPFSLTLLQQQIHNIIERRELLHQKFRQEVLTSPQEVTVTNVDEEFLQTAMEIVERNMSNTEFSVEQFVREIGVSRSKLYLKLKSLTGQSTSEFVRTVRLKRAVQLLENSGYTVKEVMFMTGFNTASYFSRSFRQQFGIVPSEYVKMQRQKRADAEAAGEGKP